MPLAANSNVEFSANDSAAILPRTIPSITVGATGAVTIDSSTSHDHRTVLITNTIAFQNNSAGSLELNDNDMIIKASDIDTIQSLLQQGQNNNWSGPGIRSAAAATDPANLTTLGMILNTPGQSFDNQSSSATDILIKYTYYGDANLDGVVNGDDYTLIDSGFSIGEHYWMNGDFNYDGTIDGSDYSLIDNAFNTQSTPLSATQTAQVAAEIASVPEPTSFVFPLFVAAMAGIPRRKRLAASRPC